MNSDKPRKPPSKSSRKSAAPAKSARPERSRGDSSRPARSGSSARPEAEARPLRQNRSKPYRPKPVPGIGDSRQGYAEQRPSKPVFDEDRPPSRSTRGDSGARGESTERAARVARRGAGDSRSARPASRGTADARTDSASRKSRPVSKTARKASPPVRSPSQSRPSTAEERAARPARPSYGALRPARPARTVPGSKHTPATRPRPEAVEPVAVQVRHITVTEHEDGQRIDNFLLKRLPGVPKSHVYQLLRSGQVRVSGGRAKADRKLVVGDEIRVPPVRIAEKGEPIRAPDAVLNRLRESIVYEDDHYLAISKPAGLASHGGTGIAYGVIEAARGWGRYEFLELAHRLDRDTSGVLLLAKSRPGLLRAQRAFRDGLADKRYFALLLGRLQGGARDVDAALVKKTLAGGERYIDIDEEEGKPSKSRFNPQAHYRDATLCEVHIYSGRTHQIRVHALALGHPVAGDRKYGLRDDQKTLRDLGLRRMFLHSHFLQLPSDGEFGKLIINAPMTDELRDFPRIARSRAITMKRFELLIFDWDGTLADSAGHIVSTMQEAILALGLPPREDQAIAELIGLGLADGMRRLYPEIETPILLRQLMSYRKHHPQQIYIAPLFTEAERALRALYTARYRLAIATGKPRAGLDGSLTHHATIASLFELSRCADETADKPNPLMLEEILADTGVAPERALMIGDTEYDMAMASAIGMPAVGVACGVHDGGRLLRAGAARVVEGVHALPGWLRAAA